MSKTDLEKPLVKNPLFSMKLGERVRWDTNSEGCTGIIVLAAVIGFCVLPKVCEALFKAVDIIQKR